MNHQDNDGITALLSAAWGGKLDLTNALIALGEVNRKFYQAWKERLMYLSSRSYANR